MSDKQTWCGNCGREDETLSTWNQGATSTLLCTKCVEKKHAEGALALEILNGHAPATIPDFGAAQDAAVKMACAMFPSTFKLRAHDGTFRVSERASYVSRGRVMLYMQRLKSTQVQSGPSRGQYQDEWVDFAKGTIGELKGQVR